MVFSFGEKHDPEGIVILGCLEGWSLPSVDVLRANIEIGTRSVVHFGKTNPISSYELNSTAKETITRHWRDRFKGDFHWRLSQGISSVRPTIWSTRTTATSHRMMRLVELLNLLLLGWERVWE